MDEQRPPEPPEHPPEEPFAPEQTTTYQDTLDRQVEFQHRARTGNWQEAVDEEVRDEAGDDAGEEADARPAPSRSRDAEDSAR